MLKGLEIVEINYKNVFNALNESKRFDSEFFQKKFLEIDKIITFKKNILFDEEIELITDGKHGGVELTEKGVLFIRNTNIKADIIDLTDERFISEAESNETKRAELDEGDLLVTTIGSIIGESVVIPKGFPKATINQNLVRIVPKDKVKSYYLSSFLNSKYGNPQIYKYAVGNIWLLVNYPNIKKIKIPVFNKNFYINIEQLHLQSQECLKLSKELYREAENILLETLGLANWQPTIKNNNTKTLKESFLQTGRIDAEYYQPKYDEVISKVSHIKNDILDNIITIQKSIEPGSDAYQNDGIPFIRVADLSKNGISETSVFLSPEEFGDYPLMPKANTILLSKDGSVGIAYKLEADIYGITSSAILHLTLKRKDVLPDYLCLVINSMIVKLQAERDAGGSIIQHWKPDEIKQVIIPIVDDAIQLNISQKVRESFLLQKQSKHLLDVAKKAVEIAIEQDEAEAFNYINQNKNA